METIEIKDIIRNRRLQLGLSYAELGKMCGSDKTTIRKWELGLIENMKRDKMVLLSRALGISPLVLLGIEEYVPDDTPSLDSGNKINVYTQVSANRFEDVITKIDNPYSSETGIFFALEVEVDTMNTLLDTPKVYAIFKQQSEVENGTTVAVALADDKTMIKKFYKFDDVIVLRPTVEQGEPMTIVGEQVDEVCILGKFVGMVSPFMQ